MKRRTLTSALILAFIAIFIASCSEKFEAPVPPPKIHFSTQNNNQMKSVKSSKSFTATKAEIVNGANYNIYGTGVTGFWWTEPPTAINWQLTGPNGLDTLFNQQELISFTFADLGVYTLRAFNPPPYGFEWFMTISVLNSLDEAMIVQPDFIRSEWIPASNVFRYYWRVPRPTILDGSETLFRVMGLSGTTYDPFPTFFNQVSFFGTDSVEWYYDYPPNGLTPFGAKTNVGYVNPSAEEIWFTIDTASQWRCQDPTENNIIEAVHYNGQVGVLGTNFAPPSGVQTGAGDYTNPIPVILVGTPVSGQLPIYALASPETNRWRHRLSSETNWTELAITPANGRIAPLLPANPSFDQRIVQYGYFDGTNFSPDPLMSLSSMYNAAAQGFVFAY